MKAKAGETIKLDLLPAPASVSEVANAIGRQMRESLTKEGLYAREAEAMVNTWRDSWFEETGLRVLYVLPTSWTDRTLPLRIEPKPQQLVRVMVGRAEVITPRMEWDVLKQVVRYSDSPAEARSEIVQNFQKLGLGRFAEPAVRKVLGPRPNNEFNTAARQLLETTRPITKDKALAAR